MTFLTMLSHLTASGHLPGAHSLQFTIENGRERHILACTASVGHVP
jgi:hypothetical protein